MNFDICHSDPMVEIIPSINVPTFEEVKERIARVEPYAAWCHLDITDGIFSMHPTWHDPANLPELTTNLKAEAHLMVAEPEKVIERWFVEPVKRIIVHLEAAKDINFIIQKCRGAGIEIGLAIHPETPWSALEPWCGKVDLFLVLTVKPGPSGQKMHEESFDKVSHLHRVCSSGKIEIDGGINPETAQKAKEAGADILVAGAYIFNSQDIAFAIQSLLK